MRFALLCGAALLLGLPAGGLLGAGPPKPPTPREKYQALVKAQQQAQEEFSKAYTAAKTDEERQRVQKELGNKSAVSHFAGQFLQLIRDHSKDPVVFDAARWLISRVGYTPEAGQAAEIVLTHWIKDERLADLCLSLRHYPVPAGEALLRKAIDKSPNRTVQGYARYSLALTLQAQADRMMDARPEDREPYEREAGKLLQQVIDKYADLKYLPTLGKAAERELFALRHLGVGKTAPDIEGVDLDGKKFKLSDYRGKVVLLDFWGSW
jgi:hypothetical protein